MKQNHKCSETGTAIPAAGAEPCSDGWLHTLESGVDMTERESRLYARYLRALALLCECAPFVDDQDYAELIDELVTDACKHYPLDCRRNGDFREIALRSPGLK